MVKKERQSLKEVSTAQSVSASSSPSSSVSDQEKASGEGDSLTYRTSNSRSSFFSIYQRIESINEFLDNLVYDFPDLVSTFSIGKSYEGRDLRLIKLSPKETEELKAEGGGRSSNNDRLSLTAGVGNATFNGGGGIGSTSTTTKSPRGTYGNNNNNKQHQHLHNNNSNNKRKERVQQRRKKREAIYLDGGFHAREWISVTTALFVASQLASDYYQPGVEGDGARRLLNHYDIYILPIANPDGYDYTHTRDRLWRKTRSRHLPYGISIFGCRGVDPNRNFEHHWNEVGSSDNPCTDIYAGPRSFSEPETKAVADFIMAHRDYIKMFFALHSYGELWLTPWGMYILLFYTQTRVICMARSHQMEGEMEIERVSKCLENLMTHEFDVFACWFSLCLCWMYLFLLGRLWCDDCICFYLFSHWQDIREPFHPTTTNWKREEKQLPTSSPRDTEHNIELDRPPIFSVGFCSQLHVHRVSISLNAELCMSCPCFFKIVIASLCDFLWESEWIRFLLWKIPLSLSTKKVMTEKLGHLSLSVCRRISGGEWQNE